MLPRHHLARVLSRRQLSTTRVASSQKLPSLGDIIHSPQNSAVFKEKLFAHREALAAQRKAALQPPPSAGAANAPDATAAGHGKGVVKSILYGSEKGQREEAEMERSYSTVLARGKYVHAIEFHHVKPDQQAAYVDLVGKIYPNIAADKGNNCHLVGSWKTEIGDPDIFGNSFPPQNTTAALG
jgi:hypothetical protein